MAVGRRAVCAVVCLGSIQTGLGKRWRSWVRDYDS